jgi:ADP-ribose pyrophosphatase YjhB (NUDIX family)
MTDNYCNNCGKQGHIYNQCKMPITSVGVIAFRLNNHQIEYLMIRRKDTLGFIDFMRGKYFVNNKYYILNMLKQMTQSEKERIRTLEFDDIWNQIWGINKLSSQYKYEENVSKIKFNSLRTGVRRNNETYKLSQLIDESNLSSIWTEPEWGFPKGRRNYQENDYNCALREFQEETGIDRSNMAVLQNIVPYEEVFTGSNYKSYKHKYFLTFIENASAISLDKYEQSEVSSIEWLSYDRCVQVIRPYNLEKLDIMHKIQTTLTSFYIMKTG